MSKNTEAKMGWLRGASLIAVVLGLVVVSCGSDRQETLQLMRFIDPVEMQPDAVGGTLAQIDVCQQICSGGGGTGDAVMFEPFSSTQSAAVVLNRGRSDIFVDRIDVTYPNGGFEPLGVNVAGGVAVVGGRCADDGRACADSSECITGGACVTQETTVPFQLFPLEYKGILAGGCDGSFESFLVQSLVAISGRDGSGERFTVTGGITLELANFDNCENEA